MYKKKFTKEKMNFFGLRFLMLAVLVPLAVLDPRAARAQVYRCATDDGKIEYNQMPCARGTQTPIDSQALAATRIAAQDTQKKKLREEARRQEHTENQKREAHQLAEAAIQIKNKVPQPVASSVAIHHESDSVDCMDLYRYAGARGHSWMEKVAIVNDAEKTGRCVRK